MEDFDTRSNHRYSKESLATGRFSSANQDNVAYGSSPTALQENSLRAQCNLEHSSGDTSALPNIENLSLNQRQTNKGQEHFDASDYYRFNSRQETSNASTTSTNRNHELCKICRTSTCVMNGGGSIEAERLKTTIAKMKAARSKAQMSIIGMEYMDPYIEAYDTQWNLDVSTVRANFKNNFTVTDGILFPPNTQFWSPLKPFCSLGKTELVAIFIHEGADVNAASAPGGTRALSQAVTWQGNEDIVEMLIAAGADVNAANSHGLTALHFAVAAANFRVVKILITAGANVDAEADNFNGIHGLPIFHQLRESQMAAYNKIIKLLIESGANTDLQSSTSWTPLQYICICGSADLARRLIELGVPKEPLDALRKKAGDRWAFSGYYKYWEKRLQEDI
ncbi:Ankyrin-3 [Arthrobotrys entomopaga]|nr:Ankyrin-3 [Arthrobotrys entomopaga]